MRKILIDDSTAQVIERLAGEVDRELPLDHTDPLYREMKLPTAPIVELIEEVRSLLRRAEKHP